METRAAIDIGSHTARLLVARVSGRPFLLAPVMRRRAYTRLGEDFDRAGKRILPAPAMDRVLEAIEGFMDCLRGVGVSRVHAAATGVMREAGNREALLDRIRRQTGIRVRLLDGAEEARLTGKGVLWGLGNRSGPLLAFDLGGGSTEFVLTSGEAPVVESIAVGAGVLTREYLPSDPPEPEELVRLSGHIDECLDTPVLRSVRLRYITDMAATGGTVTTLAAMTHGIPPEDISPERMNGLRLSLAQVQGLFQRLIELPCAERAALPGLDPGRAGVIVAGTLAVIRILEYFSRTDLAVSLSDLLEGILIQDIEGEKDG